MHILLYAFARWPLIAKIKNILNLLQMNKTKEKKKAFISNEGKPPLL